MMLRAEVACAGGLHVHEEEVANCGQHVFHRHQKKCERKFWRREAESNRR